jgi:hypothetical protein
MPGLIADLSGHFYGCCVSFMLWRKHREYPREYWTILADDNEARSGKSGYHYAKFGDNRGALNDVFKR